ncbi:MAG TPA: SGNH/GDSL hydrolase family protein [Bryobacteraceae bacterium]|nr:SGNH/GDSL hydrolase family protein [Bryobacteraceae bacterium]
MLRILIAALGLTLVLDAQSTPPPLIGLGDSIGEGVQSADASYRTQPYTYLNWIARQMGVPFPLPLIQGGALTTIESVTGRTRLDPTLAASNLAVSGADVDSLLNQQATQPVTTETDLVLEPRTGSQMQIAVSLKSPFTVCWIGNNDVLGAILAFDQLDASQMTSVPQFTADFAQIVAQLSTTGGKVVFGNIPDVTNIGFLFGPQDLVNFLGSDFGLPQGSYTTLPTMLLIKLGLFDGSILQNPNFVLSSSEVQTIQQRLVTFNQTIAVDAAQAHMPVTDIHALFQYYGQHPLTIAGVTLTDRYLGGLFSLDGVHPSNIGHAVAANAFLTTANAAFGLHIPLISNATLVQVLLADPFVDFNHDLRVRGRPFAGLLETLGPFLGISGDFADTGLPGPKIDRTLGPRFMRRYFELTGRDPNSAWSRQDAIEAMRRILGLERWKR